MTILGRLAEDECGLVVERAGRFWWRWRLGRSFGCGPQERVPSLRMTNLWGVGESGRAWRRSGDGDRGYFVVFQRSDGEMQRLVLKCEGRALS